MTKEKKTARKNKGGRPVTRGPTIPVAFRLSADLGKRIEMLRLASAEELTKTQALERLIRRALDDEEAELRKRNAESDAIPAERSRRSPSGQSDQATETEDK